jgi:hypothetical protein
MNIPSCHEDKNGSRKRRNPPIWHRWYNNTQCLKGEHVLMARSKASPSVITSISIGLWAQCPSADLGLLKDSQMKRQNKRKESNIKIDFQFKYWRLCQMSNHKERATKRERQVEIFFIYFNWAYLKAEKYSTPLLTRTEGYNYFQSNYLWLFFKKSRSLITKADDDRLPSSKPLNLKDFILFKPGRHGQMYSLKHSV